ncbi:MAG: hypothetical protein IJ482_03720 [Alphaproteobacteria bacterium]|nr:hypothetical protein [Alphaproteobacteria bacterium]
MAKKLINRADELTFGALQKAVAEDKVHICLLAGQINRPSSPVYNPWEVLLPILVPVLLGLVLILTVGPMFGLLFMAALILASTHIVKKKLDARLLQRTQNLMLSSPENFQKVWEFGGVVLVNRQNKNQGCVAPEGEWKEFVVTNFADLMIEKKEEAPKDEKAK